MPILSKNQKINGYTVVFLVKQGMCAETYRVKDGLGNNLFLKLINCAKLHHSQFDDDGNVLELQITKQLKHPNITMYRDNLTLQLNGQRFVCIVFDFIAGETAAQYLTREQTCSVYQAKQIVAGVLNGLKCIHNFSRPVIHNELTIQNVMLDLSSEIVVPKIIDFGHARYIDQNFGFIKEGVNPFYTAPEAFNGIFSPQTDLFSVGALLYHLLFGLPPYFMDLSLFQKERILLIDAVQEGRQKPLKILDANKFELDEQLINTIHKALSLDIDSRFKSADEFLKALNGEIKVLKLSNEDKVNTSLVENTCVPVRKVGKVFADVAGMVDLKVQLQSDVIDLLQHPEQAKELGLFIPNGLLFYGPPGCGKTFFAEKFAEEAGIHYRYIKCSDVASPYIHGGQGKIAAIFDDARKNAPTILFFDEIDAMIKDRNRQTNVSEAGEVNEFLAQLNNCGQNGVLVIGATNKPTEIDKAALRAGRLELKYYIPQPDKETRKSMFELNLQKRKVDFGIDYERLALLTENYISADIKLIVDMAARLTFRRKMGKITMNVLEEVIKTSKPSISIDVIHEHEAIRDKFLGIKTKFDQRRKIGFN